MAAGQPQTSTSQAQSAAQGTKAADAAKSADTTNAAPKCATNTTKRAEAAATERTEAAKLFQRTPAVASLHGPLCLWRGSYALPKEMSRERERERETVVNCG